MEKNEKNSQPIIDPSLDTPGEAATQKHINFLDVEDGSKESNRQLDKETKERKEEWQKGIEEGKKSRDNQ